MKFDRFRSLLITTFIEDQRVRKKQLGEFVMSEKMAGRVNSNGDQIQTQ